MKETTANRLRRIGSMDKQAVLQELDTSVTGLTQNQAEQRQVNHPEKQAKAVIGIVIRSFFTPFTVLLLCVDLLAFLTGFLENDGDNLISAGILFVILFSSGIIQLIQNMKAYRSYRKIGKLKDNEITVRRNGILFDISPDRLVQGDIVYLSAGSIVTADLRVIESCGLCVSQAAVTGESRIIRKTASAFLSSDHIPLPKYGNLILSGCTVISGRGEAVVVSAGKQSPSDETPSAGKNGFDKGASSIVKAILSFLTFLIPASLLVVGLTTKSFDQAFLFMLSVIVGIIPEMLPMVVSVCLSRGSRAMMKKKTLVRNVNTMQGFSGMDVLCVDKTGTLTESEINLEYFTDPLGNESEECLTLAYLNARFTGGTKNYIDRAILKYRENAVYGDALAAKSNAFRRVDESPFGYTRKFSSVLLNAGEENRLIVKGNVDEIVGRCSFVQIGGEVVEMTDDRKPSVDEVVGEMLSDGMKVLAVAKKSASGDSINETGLTLVGYLGFFDAPKRTAKEAIRRLKEGSVDVVLLTGDDAEVACSVCKRIGIPHHKVVRGAELERFTEEQFTEALETVKIFAELTPDQKVSVVNGLKSNGHTVGYLGDGINDIPALCSSDVAISVDTAQETAKEIADVLLLEKDLNVLADGVTEGRRIFTNLQKYVNITASSNFGNVLSLVLASIFLAFQPMIAVQLLLLNILYDLLCFTISFDNVDKEELKKPKTWTGRGLVRFAVTFGTVSSVFDILTFLFLYHLCCPAASNGDAGTFVALFQTGWFLESMWSQILILNILRTKKLPFIQSRPSALFLAVCLCGIVLFTVIPFTPIGVLLGFTAMPALYFGYLVLSVVLYIAVVLLVKALYLKKSKEVL